MSNEFSTPKLNPADNVKIPGVDGNNDSGYLLSEEVKDYMVGGVYGTTPEYSTLETYSVGERVMNEGILYRCITAVSTPEVFNPAKWTKIDLPTMDSAITSLSDNTFVSYTVDQTYVSHIADVKSRRVNGVLYFSARIVIKVDIGSTWRTILTFESDLYGGYFDIIADDGALVKMYIGGKNLMVQNASANQEIRIILATPFQ